MKQRGPDLLVVLFLAMFTLVAHPVSLVMRRPFWIDEAWVAVLTRVPWSRLPSLSSSTPIGWLALARLVPGSGLQRARGLVLGFAVGGVVAVYALVRSLDWPSRRAARIAGAATALVVSCAPLSIVRNDLKQYTADAFFAVLLLGIGRWVERQRAAWSVACLGAAALVAIPFSTVSAFVSIAVFAGVLVSALLTRDRDRVRASLTVGAATAVFFVSYFAAFVFPKDTPALKQFWANMYLDGSPGEMLQQTWRRLQNLKFALGMPAIVAVTLFVVAIVLRARRREHTLAIAMPILWLEMFLLGATHRYPFLDQRTSHFILVPSIAVIAVGVVDLVFALARRNSGTAVVGAPVIAVLFGIGVHRFWRHVGIPYEDPRTATQFAAEHMQPGDVILVDWATNWGFAYYWPHGRVETHRDNEFGNGFTAAVNNLDNVVYAPGRSDNQMRLALRDALDRQRLAGSRGRLFIVRSHMSPRDRARWDDAFAALHISPHIAIPGVDPLLVLYSPN